MTKRTCPQCNIELELITNEPWIGGGTSDITVCRKCGMIFSVKVYPPKPVELDVVKLKKQMKEYINSI